MITPILIETQRLYLNPLTATTVRKTIEGKEFKENITVDENVVEVTYKENWPGDAIVMFPKFIKNFDDEILGTMTIINKENNEAIGLIGIKYESPDLNDLLKIEFGYGIIKEYEGKGIATEALKAFTDYLTNYSDFTSAIAFVENDNKASSRVLEKNDYKEIECKKENHKAYLKSVKK